MDDPALDAGDEDALVDDVDTGADPEDDLDGLDDTGDGDGGDPDPAATDPDPAPPRREPSRRERQVAEQRRLRREAEERAIRAEAERDALRSQHQQPQSAAAQAEAERAERERVSLMSPDERFDYLRQRDRNEFSREIQITRLQMADQTDRLAFESTCRTHKLYASVAQEVEVELDKIRRGGGNTNREVIANYLLGKRVADRAVKDGTRQRQAGDARVRQETTRPGSARGDVGAGDRRRGKTAAERLEGVQI